MVKLRERFERLPRRRHVSNRTSPCTPFRVEERLPLWLGGFRTSGPEDREVYFRCVPLRSKWWGGFATCASSIYLGGKEKGVVRQQGKHMVCVRKWDEDTLSYCYYSFLLQRDSRDDLEILGNSSSEVLCSVRKSSHTIGTMRRKGTQQFAVRLLSFRDGRGEKVTLCPLCCHDVTTATHQTGSCTMCLEPVE